MLLNIQTQQRIQDHEIRLQFPAVSFPETLTSESVEPFGFAILNQPTVPTSTATQYVVDAGNEKIGNDWFIKYSLVDKTPEELANDLISLKNEIIATVQTKLDAFARTRGYDSILSATTYATSSVPEFASEGQYAVSARDTIWAALYEVLADVEAGRRPVPTLAEIGALLPTLTWPA